MLILAQAEKIIRADFAGQTEALRAETKPFPGYPGHAIAWAARPVERKPQPDLAKNRPVATSRVGIFKPMSGCKQEATLKAIGNFRNEEQGDEVHSLSPERGAQKVCQPNNLGPNRAVETNVAVRGKERRKTAFAFSQPRRFV